MWTDESFKSGELAAERALSALRANAEIPQSIGYSSAPARHQEAN